MRRILHTVSREGFYPFTSASGISVPSQGWFAWTGEKRPPRKGEYFLSGAIVEAYQAYSDLNTPYHIARPVELVKCQHCDGFGKVGIRQWRALG